MSSDLHPLDPQAPGVIASMLRFWRPSLLIVLGAALIALAVSSLLPERYEAAAKIELIDPSDDQVFPPSGNLPVDLERYTERQTTVMVSASVLGRAAQAVGAGSAGDVRDDVGASALSPGQLYVSASAGSADDAAELANATTDAFRSVTRANAEQRTADALAAIEKALVGLEAQVDDVSTQLATDPTNRLLQARRETALGEQARLEQRATELQVNNDAFDDGVNFVDAAEPPDSPVEPRPLRNAGVAALLGLLVAGAIAWFRADRHRAADDSTTPAAVLDAPLLGGIPVLERGTELAALQDSASAPAEAYQVVTASLQHVFRWGVLLVTSASRGDGKTVSAASLAATAARDGSRVILVDADVREAALTARLIGMSDRRSSGLADVADAGDALDDAIRLMRLSEDVVLPFLPAGRPVDDVGSLFRSAGASRTLQALRETYDLVIIDCAPLLPVADVASLAVHADGIVAVVRRGTPIAMLSAMRQRLDLIAAPLVGYLFSRAEGASETYLATPSASSDPRRTDPSGTARWPVRRRQEAAVASGTGPRNRSGGANAANGTSNGEDQPNGRANGAGKRRGGSTGWTAPTPPPDLPAPAPPGDRGTPPRP